MLKEKGVILEYLVVKCLVFCLVKQQTGIVIQMNFNNPFNKTFYSSKIYARLNKILE